MPPEHSISRLGLWSGGWKVDTRPTRFSACGEPMLLTSDPGLSVPTDAVGVGTGSPVHLFTVEMSFPKRPGYLDVVRGS
jgi:hypothetical protein